MLASRKPRRRRALLAPSALLLCAGVLGARLLLASSSSPARRLVEHPTGGESFSLVTLVLGDASCTTAYDGYLAVGVLFALVLYTFLGLAIVCDEYFCESLEQISSALTPGMGYLLLFLQLCYTGWNVGKHADCPWGKCIPDDVTARLSEIFQAGSAP